MFNFFYGDFINVQQKKNSPSWIYPGETIQIYENQANFTPTIPQYKSVQKLQEEMEQRSQEIRLRLEVEQKRIEYFTPEIEVFLTEKKIKKVGYLKAFIMRKETIGRNTYKFHVHFNSEKQAVKIVTRETLFLEGFTEELLLSEPKNLMNRDYLRAYIGLSFWFLEPDDYK